MGNKICDGSDYNTKECGWDGGDCLDANKDLWKQFPKCVNGVDPSLIGNGRCDNGGNENTEECGWDGEECFAFNLEYPHCTSRFGFKISNGNCEDAIRRDGGMGNQKGPAPKIFEISYKFGSKVFENYPLYDSTQPTICIPSSPQVLSVSEVLIEVLILGKMLMELLGTIVNKFGLVKLKAMT